MSKLLATLVRSLFPPREREIATMPSPRAEAYAARCDARAGTVTSFSVAVEAPPSPQLAAERADNPAPVAPVRILRCASR